MKKTQKSSKSEKSQKSSKSEKTQKSSKIEKLWLVYFLIMGLLAMLQWTLLYPIVLM